MPRVPGIRSSAGVLVPAAWSSTLVRFFLLDNENGNDGNQGYVDAAAGATLAPAGLAKKSITALMAIIPTDGNGRTAVVLQKSRSDSGNYVDAAAAQESINLNALHNYSGFVWRGSTDLTNDAADRITCGARIAVAGPNGDSSFTIGAAGSTTLLNFNAGSIAAEPTALQYRVRFLPTTPTVALRNICRPITSHTTTSVTVGSAFPASPASGGSPDLFVIEGPGTTVVGMIAEQPLATGGAGSAMGVVVAGLRFTSTVARSVRFRNLSMKGSLLECNGATNNVVFSWENGPVLSMASTYVDETVATVTTGMGFRCTASLTILVCPRPFVAQLGAMNTAVAPSIDFGSMANGGSIGDQSYFAKGCSLGGFSGPAGANNTASGFSFGRVSASNAQPRVNGAASAGLFLSGGGITVKAVDFQNCGAVPCIKVNQAGGFPITIDGCTGSTGNTDVALDVSQASRLLVETGRGTANTFTGTAGDIRLAGPVITTHAGLAVTNVTDRAQNRILGSADAVVDQCEQFTNADGSALAIGAVVRVSVAGSVVRAFGDTNPHASGPLFIAVTPPANAAAGLFVPAASPAKWVLFDGAPTLLSIADLSITTTGTGTTTAPPVAATNQKRRLGIVAATQAGNLGLVTGACDNDAVNATGAL